MLVFVDAQCGAQAVGSLAWCPGEPVYRAQRDGPQRDPADPRDVAAHVTDVAIEPL